MKKLFSLLLAVAMMLGMVSFAVAEGPIQVDVFYFDYSDPYLSSVRDAMQKTLDGLADKFAYNFYDCGSDQAKQNNFLESALTKGTDLVIMNVVTTGSEEAAQNLVDMCKEKDVPIIFFNREIADSVVQSYEKCAFVGTDPDEAGYLQGQGAADFFLAEGNMDKFDLNKDGKISYVMFRGELGNPEAFGRTKYSVQKANELGVALIPSAANQKDDTQEDDGISPYYLYANWRADLAKNLMDTALTTFALDNGDIELVLANNDEAAMGAIESMNEKGYNTGAEGAGYIPVFGVDATPAAVDAINNGKMTGTVKQDGVAMANFVVALAENIQGGKALMDGTENLNVDEGVAKIRVPYAMYTGEK